ncbi:MAG: tetratricopeptide repeat protein [Myxococcales bacterium]|nr:tetratricopeptide repeat protein [Myxococcales bacterium]
MKRVQTLALGLLSVVFLVGGNCSRARVESMNHMNEGVVYAQQKRHIDAVKALERSTAIDPSNDQAFYNLAMVHMELRHFARAKEDMERAISANGEVGGYHEKLGTILMELEDWEHARAAFEQAIETDAQLFKAYYKLAQVFEKLDDQQNALQRYTEAIQHGPRFLEAYTQLGRLYADLGYLDESAQVLRSGLDVAMPGTEEEAQLHHMLGTVLQQQENMEGAIAEFRAALEIVPGMADALFSLGWTYALVDNQEEGRRFLKKYVEVAGPEAPAHYMKAAQDKLSTLGGLEGP